MLCFGEHRISGFAIGKIVERRGYEHCQKKQLFLSDFLRSNGLD